MNELINSLIGKHVQVDSVSGDTRYTDNGVLNAYEHPWLKVTKDGGDVLYFCAYRIRIVKEIP